MKMIVFQPIVCINDKTCNNLKSKRLLTSLRHLINKSNCLKRRFKENIFSSIYLYKQLLVFLRKSSINCAGSHAHKWISTIFCDWPIHSNHMLWSYHYIIYVTLSFLKLYVINQYVRWINYNPFIRWLPHIKYL